MIRTGYFQDLTMLRSSSMGVYVGLEDEDEILIPKETNKAPYVRGGKLRVFIYRDADKRRVASTLSPRLQVGEFAQMRVNSVTEQGAFVDWGLTPELFIPRSEQKKALEEGRWYVMHLALDEKNDQLYGSTRIDEILNNETLTVQERDKVDLMVFGRSELGFSVTVNNVHQGLIHTSDVFRPISIGDRIEGYVKTIREDNKLDIAVQPIGYRQYNDVNVELLAKRLRATGIVPLNDKSTADAIYREFGISKKAFKKALGALYKDRKVRIEDDGVIWIGDR